jgi:hypothetical protein
MHPALPAILQHGVSLCNLFSELSRHSINMAPKWLKLLDLYSSNTNGQIMLLSMLAKCFAHCTRTTRFGPCDGVNNTEYRGEIFFGIESAFYEYGTLAAEASWFVSFQYRCTSSAIDVVGKRSLPIARGPPDLARATVSTTRSIAVKSFSESSPHSMNMALSRLQLLDLYPSNTDAQVVQLMLLGKGVCPLHADHPIWPVRRCQQHPCPT